MPKAATVNRDLSINQEPPNTPDALTLLQALDDYLGGLYAPENQHGLSVAQLQEAGVCFLIARLDGVAVGCGAIRLSIAAAPTAAADYAEIKRMYVDPSWRGRGIAQALLHHLEEKAVQHGVSLLRLETGIHQHDAMKLYERSGFFSCPAFGDYEENGISLFYEKRLVTASKEPVSQDPQRERTIILAVLDELLQARRRNESRH